MKRNKNVEAQLFNRKRIYDLMCVGVSCGDVFITAGPGYGKTSSLLLYREQCEGRCCYLPLTKQHDSWEAFEKLLVDAVWKEYGQRLLPEISGEEEKLVEWVCELLPKETLNVLIIDDYHLISDEKVQKFLDLLIRWKIPQLSLMVSSQTKSSAEKITVSSGVLQLEELQMRYTMDEIAELFKKKGKTISNNLCEFVFEQTEGWPGVVHQLCEEIQEEEEIAKVLNTSCPSRAAYLFENKYFMREPEAFRKLLVKLSFLPFFSLEMIKNLYPYHVDEATYFFSRHVFVQYKYDSSTFKFHKMYQTFLQTKVSFLTDDQISETYRIASRWYKRKGYFSEAVYCDFHGKDYDSFLWGLNPGTKWRNAKEEVVAVLNMLKEIPESYREDHPEYYLYLSIFYIQDCQMERAYKQLADLASFLEEKEKNEKELLLLGEVYMEFANVCLCLTKAGAVAMSYVDKARKLLPEGYRIRGNSFLMVEYCPGFFLEDNRENEVEEGMKFLFDNQGGWSYLLNQMAGGFEYLYAAKIYYDRYMLEEAHIYCYQAIRTAKKEKQYDVLMYATFVLMKIWISRGNYEMVSRCLNEVTEYLEQYPYESLKEMAEAIFAWHDIYLGDMKAIQTWVEKYNHAVLTGGQLKYIRNTVLCAMQLAEKGSTLQLAYELIIRLEVSVKENRDWLIIIMIRLIRAKYYLKSQKISDAEKCFKEAVRLAYPNQIQFPILYMGNDTLELLEIVSDTWETKEEKAWAERLYHNTIEYRKNYVAVAKQCQIEKKDKKKDGVILTKREIEVISLLAEGWTGNEIGYKLGISINGVKKHLSRIYAKLGAVNRADAIHIAFRKGILKDE